MRHATVLLVFTLLAAGCDRGPDAAEDRVRVSRALSGVLAYPQSSMVSLSAGDEAGQLVLTSPASVAEIAAWYRQALALNGWELLSDAADRSGGATMYAQKQGRPLWITLRPNTGGRGTTYTLVGAFVGADSTSRGSTAR